MITVDTAIIGGGPAGMACAIALQKKGVSVLVIEKRQFPREKTCGGYLTDKTVQQLKKLADPALLERQYRQVFDRVELYDRDRLLTSSPISLPLRAIRRRDFDAFLAGLYREAGGRLLENSVCRRIDPAEGRLELSTGEEVRFSHLVVSDGALSPTARQLGYPARPLGFCVETFVPKDRLPQIRTPRIVFGLVSPGYAWVFPSGEEICIGFGNRYTEKMDYAGILKDYLRQLGADPEAAVIRGAFLPYGPVLRQKRSQSSVLLVGDAGGYLDPIYGEGLYFAVTSGMEAAEAIAGGGGECLSDYLRRMEPHRKTIRQGLRFQKLFFSGAAQRLFVKKVAGRNRFVGFYCDRQVARYTYSYAGLRKLFLDYRRWKKG